MKQKDTKVIKQVARKDNKIKPEDKNVKITRKRPNSHNRRIDTTKTRKRNGN